MLRDSLRRSPASRIFDHLSEEERIDRACELLALGVLRLAEKRGLLKGQKVPSSENSDDSKKAA
ncbi:MAG: hypothetical protein HYZ84_07475 [Candidatus Omnitrophica bacterium]|nr:hypothetical protein [Candidatus Omnitrophota bacterium]